MATSSRMQPPTVNLKERIAALQQRTNNSSPNSRSTSPPPPLPVAPLHSLHDGPNATIRKGLRDKIAKFEQKGGVPIPRGSFGLGAPPLPENGQPKRRGELYGNRIPAPLRSGVLTPQVTGGAIGSWRSVSSPAGVLTPQMTGGGTLTPQITGGTLASWRSTPPSPHSRATSPTDPSRVPSPDESFLGSITKTSSFAELSLPESPTASNAAPELATIPDVDDTSSQPCHAELADISSDVNAPEELPGPVLVCETVPSSEPDSSGMMAPPFSLERLDPVEAITTIDDTPVSQDTSGRPPSDFEAAVSQILASVTQPMPVTENASYQESDEPASPRPADNTFACPNSEAQPKDLCVSPAPMTDPSSSVADPHQPFLQRPSSPPLVAGVMTVDQPYPSPDASSPTSIRSSFVSPASGQSTTRLDAPLSPPVCSVIADLSRPASPTASPTALEFTSSSLHKTPDSYSLSSSGLNTNVGASVPNPVTFSAVVHKKVTEAAFSLGPMAKTGSSATHKRESYTTDPLSPGGGGELTKLAEDAALLELLLSGGEIPSDTSNDSPPTDDLPTALMTETDFEDANELGPGQEPEHNLEPETQSLRTPLASLRSTLSRSKSSHIRASSVRSSHVKQLWRQTAVPLHRDSHHFVSVSSVDEAPPMPPPKSPGRHYGAMQTTTSVQSTNRRRPSTVMPGAYPRDSVSMSSEDSVAVITPPDNTSDFPSGIGTASTTFGKVGNTLSVIDFGPVGANMSRAGTVGPGLSLSNSKAGSPKKSKSFSRAASFAERMFQRARTKSSGSTVSASVARGIAADAMDEPLPVLSRSSLAPSTSPTGLQPPSPTSPNRPESWISVSSTTSSARTVDLFDAFPSVPHGSDFHRVGVEPSNATVPFPSAYVSQPKFTPTTA